MTPESTWELPGLDGEAEILIDEWGIPHIYALSIRDAYSAQGFNAARDRLFQIDLWRRRGLGRLAEVLGPGYVEQDRARRLFTFRGSAEEEWEAYEPGTRDAVEAFVLGVNAYVTWVLENPQSLPPEFVNFGYLPALWEPEDVVRVRCHGLFYNAEQEIARAVTIREGGEEADLIRQAREPEAPLRVPEGLSLADVRLEDLDVLRLALSPVSFDGRSQAELWQQATSGSNNWAIAGDRTSTGRPILANDPHRAVTLPSLRYVAHLSAPGLDVIGAGEPSLPGISIGHNGQVAFGLTIWPIDQEDIYFYEIDSGGTSYRYAGEWVEFGRLEEEVAVAGTDPVMVELLFSQHGPVLRVDRERSIAIAVRAA